MEKRHDQRVKDDTHPCYLRKVTRGGGSKSESKEGEGNETGIMKDEGRDGGREGASANRGGAIQGKA